MNAMSNNSKAREVMLWPMGNKAPPRLQMEASSPDVPALWLSRLAGMTVSRVLPMTPVERWLDAKTAVAITARPDQC